MYMGLIPDARGQSFGGLVVSEAIRLVRESGRNRLILAADTQNVAALQCYERSGFRPFHRQSVFLKALPER